MIGAKSNRDAITEASRSVSDPRHILSLDRLQVWNGVAYVGVQP